MIGTTSARASECKNESGLGMDGRLDPTDRMQTTTYTRSKLQGLAEENRLRAEAAALAQKRASVHQYIQNTLLRDVLREAGVSKTSYLHPSPHPNIGFAPEDLMEGLRAWFPDCTIELTEEWVDVPNRPGQPPTRTLKSGIKIDWS